MLKPFEGYQPSNRGHLCRGVGGLQPIQFFLINWKGCFGVFLHVSILKKNWILVKRVSLRETNYTMTTEYYTHLSEPWFSLIRDGLKTCEGRPLKDDFALIKIDDVIPFYHELGISCTNYLFTVSFVFPWVCTGRRIGLLSARKIHLRGGLCDLSHLLFGTRTDIWYCGHSFKKMTCYIVFYYTQKIEIHTLCAYR